ncbi:hypothetical protein [Arthrobacter sp. zg-Y1110]|uniref:hypothetical protein n=1 Tax=Arthrobacter sp. zg-Y1110 TaxID=2886932 RepID=UPI001D13CC28|nr:hypothetical protein [Arthrobacter sp. zg-Y1110]MCC3292507.1 hypothetical protein [Arthrobacter sp. zg-Y1110]UWX87061.1 hypothetical protein N2K99_17060 [Arthrobacter sp. zg-Y1110]
MPRITPEDRAASYINWISRTGLVPSRVSPDPAEKFLYSSYLYLKGKDRTAAEEEALASMTGARDAVRKSLSDSGKPRRSFKPRGMQAARRLAAFHEANGRLPLNRIESERKLYEALRNLRHRHSVGELSSEAVEVLSGIPGVFTVVRRPPLPELEKLEAWCAASRRMPRYDILNRSTEAEKLEEHLGRWLYRHVHRRHNPVETDETRMIRNRILALQDTYPPTSAVKADREAQEILEFIQDAGRLPDLHHEPILFWNASHLRWAYSGKAGKFGAAIRQCLSAIEELPSAVNSRWDGWFADLQDSVRTEGRLSPAAVGGTRRELAAWLASAPAIADPARAARLDEFLAGFEEYPAA